MSITKDGWFVDTYVKWLTGVIALNPASATPGAFMFAMFDDTITPNFSQVNPAYNSAPFNSGQVSGAGYDPGGLPLQSLVFEEHPSAAGWVRWDFANLAWTGSTITGAKGGLIYAPALSNRALLLKSFGQAYSTNDGEFGINLHTDGIAKSLVVAP